MYLLDRVKHVCERERRRPGRRSPLPLPPGGLSGQFTEAQLAPSAYDLAHHFKQQRERQWWWLHVRRGGTAGDDQQDKIRITFLQRWVPTYHGVHLLHHLAHTTCPRVFSWARPIIIAGYNPVAFVFEVLMFLHRLLYNTRDHG